MSYHHRTPAPVSDQGLYDARSVGSAQGLAPVIPNPAVYHSSSSSSSSPSSSRRSRSRRSTHPNDAPPSALSWTMPAPHTPHHPPSHTPSQMQQTQGVLASPLVGAPVPSMHSHRSRATLPDAFEYMSVHPGDEEDLPATAPPFFPPPPPVQPSARLPGMGIVAGLKRGLNGLKRASERRVADAQQRWAAANERRAADAQRRAAASERRMADAQQRWAAANAPPILHPPPQELMVPDPEDEEEAVYEGERTPMPEPAVVLTHTPAPSARVLAHTPAPSARVLAPMPAPVLTRTPPLGPEDTPPLARTPLPPDGPLPTPHADPEYATLPAHVYEIRPSSAAANLSPRTMSPKPASDYDGMAYSMRTPSELSVTPVMSRVVEGARAVWGLPWIAPSRVTRDYIPGERVRRRHRPKPVPGGGEEAGGAPSPFDLLREEASHVPG